MLVQIVVIAVVLLVVGILAIVGLAALKPNTIHVERTLAMHAPPERIFPLISDFHQWRSWSPYENRDPEMQRTYSGAASGTGAVYEWNGNNSVGAGRMEILRSTPPSHVAIQLDFLRPFEGHNTAEFALQPQGDHTSVTWSMHGPARFISKLMSVFLNFDKMIGTDFENGLANMKATAEK
ncbi:MAG: SRPBCC family protein [Pirellulales bacterium]